MKIFPTPYIVRALLDSGLLGTNVSTRWQGAADRLPAGTVTLLGDINPLDEWTSATAQVDVWADTEDAAGSLAYDVAEWWRTRAPGPVGDLHADYFWVEQMPRPFEDETSTYRYLLEVGITLSKEMPNG